MPQPVGKATEEVFREVAELDQLGVGIPDQACGIGAR